MQHVVRVRRSLDVELVPGRAVERGSLIRPDLRLDLERAQQRECATRDRRADEVEMNRNLAAAAQVHAAGDMEEAG